MLFAVRKFPKQPRIDGTENQVAFFGTFTGALDVIKNPLNFRSAEICVCRKSGHAADILFISVLFQLFAKFRGAAALPNYRIVNGFARMSVPYDRRLTLIRYTYRGDLFGVDIHFGYRLGHNAVLARVNFHRVVLDPTLFRIDLRKLSLRNGDDFSFCVKNDRTGTCCSLVESKNVFFHVRTFLCKANQSIFLFLSFKFQHKPDIQFFCFRERFRHKFICQRTHGHFKLARKFNDYGIEFQLKLRKSVV